jgi:hypothetical protein
MRQTAMLILANIVSVFANQVMAASMDDMDQSKGKVSKRPSGNKAILPRRRHGPELAQSYPKAV